MRLAKTLTVGLALSVLLVWAGVAEAQSNGTLTGFLTDPDGSALPGVTVTASGPAMIGTRTTVSDGTGYYRLLNLTPGTYTVVAELQGFSTVQQEGIVMRLGATFRQDMTLQLGGLEETITVTAETPMIDIDNPGQVFNIDGDFQRAVPVQGRKNWSDFIELTPGVHARPFDDGSGRMVYFGHAAEHFHHVIQLEGQIGGGYRDAQPTYVQMSTDMIADVQIRSGGTEAAAPIGIGLVINVVTKSGGNQLSGTAGMTFQPMGWNGDNDPGGKNPSTPTVHEVKQLDFSLGGPLARDKAWFFISGRYAKNKAGISRTGVELQRLKDYNPSWEPFNNLFEGFFPYAKVSAQLDEKHLLNAYYQMDLLDFTGDREYHDNNRPPRNTGGSLYGVKLTSILSNNLSTELLVSYNDKTSAYDSLEAATTLSGPAIRVHESTYLSGGRTIGTGRLVDAGNVGTVTIGPSSLLLLRGDVTNFIEDTGGGSHELKFGVYANPQASRHDTTNYLNDGFIYENRAYRDPDNPSAGTYAFHRQYVTPLTLERLDNSDSDIGVYLQDSWNATNQLTIQAGIRADWIKRQDNIFGVQKMKDTAIGPRFGFSYLLTDDAKNVLRGSLTRVHEQMNGRDYGTSFTGAASARAQVTNVYDDDGDGIFETTFVSSSRDSVLAAHSFDPGLHQPWVDEAIVGYRRQFGTDVAADLSFIYRVHKHRYGDVDVNGFWPTAANQPFGGWGKVDPDEGRLGQLTNNDWSSLVYRALELTVSKRMADNWQFMGSVSRQFHYLSGDFNPTDPAKFTEPEKFENSKCIWMPRGRRDSNSYGLGSTSTYCPTWRNYSIRLGGSWFAPYGMTMGWSFVIQDGPWSGNILEKIDAPDPVFGPSVVVSSTGNTESNPLAGVVRFKNATRNVGQVKLPDIKFFNVRIGKELELGSGRVLELSVNILNPFNWADFQQYTYNGANQSWNPNFLGGRSMQAARGFQAFGNLKF